MATKTKMKKSQEMYWRAAGQPEPKSGPAAYSLWLNRIHSAFQWRAARKNGDRQWKRYYEMYQGDHWWDSSYDSSYLSSDNPRDHITVNKTGSAILTMVPFLISGEIKFLLKPRRPADTDSALVQQSLLNYAWKEKKMTRQVKKVMYDRATIGHGVVKIEYAFDVDDLEDLEGEEGRTINYDSFVRQDEPYIRRVNPFYFVFDPQAPQHDLDTARWCCEMFFRPLPDVLADPLYNEEAKELIRSGAYAPAAVTTRRNHPPTTPSTVGAYDSILPEDNLVILFEVWDKGFKQRLVLADNVPKPLIEGPWPYDYLDNFPYEKVDYIPVQNEPYGIGIPQWMEDQQYELNRVRTSIFEHRRRFNRKYLAILGQIAEEEAYKFEDGEDGTVVFGKSPNAIVAIPDAPMSGDTERTEAAINADIQEIVGLDAVMRGAPVPARTTAGEIGTRASVFIQKLNDRIDETEEFVEAVGSQVLKHIKANFLVERVVETVGPQGSEWRRATPDQIKRDVDVEVESFSAPKTDEDVERQQWLQILQLAIQGLPLVEKGILRLDYNQVFKSVFEKFGQREIQKFFPAAFAPPQLPPGQASGQQQQQIPTTPPEPSEGLTPQDLRQAFTGAAMINNGFQGGG